MKDDLPYFSHDNDARNHAKMKALRARYGWTGYGQFWALNEMIAGAAYARLDLSRKVVKAGAACELGMTPDALEDFLKFLSDYEECGLIHYKDGVITTDRTQENFERVESDRLRKRSMGVSSTEKRKNGAEESQYGAEESNKLNETKRKEIKEDKEEDPANRFKKPTLEEITDYCKERNNQVEPQRFIDHYEANGWMVGKAKMKNWKAAVRTWEKYDIKFAPVSAAKPEYKEPEETPVSQEIQDAIDRQYAKFGM